MSAITVVDGIEFRESLAGITADDLADFCQGWRERPGGEAHLRMLGNSQHVVLAVDEKDGRVVGFINALTDGEYFAFIPMLEVLEAYRGRGIGRGLVERMLQKLTYYRCVDLTCDVNVQCFYEQLGMVRSVGMILRK